MIKIPIKIQKRLRAVNNQLEAVVAPLILGEDGPYLSRREAYELYGKENVKAWLQRGLVKLQHPGDPGPIRMAKLWLDVLPVLAETESCLNALHALQPAKHKN